MAFSLYSVRPPGCTRGRAQGVAADTHLLLMWWAEANQEISALYMVTVSFIDLLKDVKVTPATGWTEPVVRLVLQGVGGAGEAEPICRSGLSVVSSESSKRLDVGAFYNPPHLSQDHLHPFFINLCVNSLDMKNRPRARRLKMLFLFFSSQSSWCSHAERLAPCLRTKFQCLSLCRDYSVCVFILVKYVLMMNVSALINLKLMGTKDGL